MDCEIQVFLLVHMVRPLAKILLAKVLLDHPALNYTKESQKSIWHGAIPGKEPPGGHSGENL